MKYPLPFFFPELRPTPPVPAVSWTGPSEVPLILVNQHERSFIKPLLVPFPISSCLLLVTWAASLSLEVIRAPHFHRKKPGLPAWHSHLHPSHHTSHASWEPPFSKPSAGAFLLLHLTDTIPLLHSQCVLVTQSCLVLCDPWTVACQAPLSMEFSRQEYWSGCHSLL